jgi:hypothetical protein
VAEGEEGEEALAAAPPSSGDREVLPLPPLRRLPLLPHVLRSLLVDLLLLLLLLLLPLLFPQRRRRQFL